MHHAAVVFKWSDLFPLLAHLDPQSPFVPETAEELVVTVDSVGGLISCRVSYPDSHVILRSVPSGEEMSAFYDNKMGFFLTLSPGQYQCETTVNGQTVRSAVYTVKSKGTSRRQLHLLKCCLALNGKLIESREALAAWMNMHELCYYCVCLLKALK